MPFAKHKKAKSDSKAERSISEQIIFTLSQGHRIALMNYIRAKNNDSKISENGFCLGDCLVFAIETLNGRQKEWYKNLAMPQNDGNISKYFKSKKKDWVVDKKKIDKLQEDYLVFGYLNFLNKKKEQKLTEADIEYCKQIYGSRGMNKYFKSNPKTWDSSTIVNGQVKNLEEGLSKKKKAHDDYLMLMEYFNSTLVIQDPSVLAMLDEPALKVKDPYKQYHFPIILNWLLGYAEEHNFKSVTDSHPTVKQDQNVGDLFCRQYQTENVIKDDTYQIKLKEILDETIAICGHDKMIQVDITYADGIMHAQMIFYHADTQLFDFFDPNGVFSRGCTSQQLVGVIESVYNIDPPLSFKFNYLGRRNEKLNLWNLTDAKYLEHAKHNLLYEKFETLQDVVLRSIHFKISDPVFDELVSSYDIAEVGYRDGGEKLRILLELIKDRNSKLGMLDNPYYPIELSDLLTKTIFHLKDQEYSVDMIKVLLELGAKMENQHVRYLELNKEGVPEQSRQALIQLLKMDIDLKDINENNVVVLLKDISHNLDTDEMKDFILSKIQQNTISASAVLTYLLGETKENIDDNFIVQVLEASIVHGMITKKEISQLENWFFPQKKHEPIPPGLTFKQIKALNQKTLQDQLNVLASEESFNKLKPFVENGLIDKEDIKVIFKRHSSATNEQIEKLASDIIDRCGVVSKNSDALSQRKILTYAYSAPESSNAPGASTALLREVKEDKPKIKR